MNGKNNGKNSFSIKDVYNLVEAMRKELTFSIRTLENKFDTMEAGRLTGMEIEFAKLKADSDTVKKIVYGVVALILTSFVGALLVLVLK